MASAKAIRPATTLTPALEAPELASGVEGMVEVAALEVVAELEALEEAEELLVEREVVPTELEAVPRMTVALLPVG